MCPHSPIEEAFWEPYRFLDGQTPVQVSDRKGSVETIIDRAYAFRADFDELNQRVSQELAQQGLSAVADDHSFGPRAIQYERERNRTNSSFTDFVIVYQDMHYKLPQYGEPYGIVGYDDPGWVSIQVYLALPDESPKH